jgi:hypothetical protein
MILKVERFIMDVGPLALEEWTFGFHKGQEDS